MPYRLQSTEAVAAGVRRAASEQLAGAATGLRDAADPSGEADAVHEARKACKRARAALRVLRDAVGTKAYRQHNAAVRDTARVLAGTRDAVVVNTALRRLVRRANDPAVYDGLTLGQPATPPEVDAAAVAETLGTLAADVAALELGSAPGFAPVAPGVRRVYRRGAAALALARKAPTTEHLHEWRKQVKYLWHTVELFAPAWPAALDPLADETHRLSDQLGDDHDLALLATRLDGRAEPTPGDLSGLLARRRVELQRRALPLGARVYADRPKAWTARLGTIVDAWHDEQSGDRSAAPVGITAP